MTSLIQTLNNPDRKGLWANIGLFLFLVLAENALIFALGINDRNSEYPSPSFAPPGWVIGLIWVILFIFYGCSRWQILREDGLHAERVARWIYVMVGWCLLYPLLTAGFNQELGYYFNFASLILTIIVIWQVRGLSRRAAAWLLPSLLWISFACFLGWATLYL